MSTQQSKLDYINFLKNEIQVLNSRIEEHDTGHLYTTISVLKHRVEEIENELKPAGKLSLV
jgi:hypothetical protein